MPEPDCTHVPGVPPTVQNQNAPSAAGTMSPATHVPETGAPDAVARKYRAAEVAPVVDAGDQSKTYQADVFKSATHMFTC